MIDLDWIPVICRTVARNSVGRSYLSNRIADLKESLRNWEKKNYRLGHDVDLWNFPRYHSFTKQLENLISREFALLEIAVKNLDTWCNNGPSDCLERAQISYEKSRYIWRKRLELMEKAWCSYGCR